jgi:hypothetical protein
VHTRRGASRRGKKEVLVPALWMRTWALQNRAMHADCRNPRFWLLYGRRNGVVGRDGTAGKSGAPTMPHGWVTAGGRTRDARCLQSAGGVKRAGWAGWG